MDGYSRDYARLPAYRAMGPTLGGCREFFVDGLEDDLNLQLEAPEPVDLQDGEEYQVRKENEYVNPLPRIFTKTVFIAHFSLAKDGHTTFSTTLNRSAPRRLWLC